MTVNAMRMIFGRLGFVAPGPEMLVVDQRINRIEELSDLDNDEVETLLKLFLCSGGTILNLNAANAAQPAHIHAPGISAFMHTDTPQACCICLPSEEENCKTTPYDQHYLPQDQGPQEPSG